MRQKHFKDMLLGITMLAASSACLAADTEFSVTELGSYDFPTQYHQLDLSNATDVKLIVSDHQPINNGHTSLIESIDIIFPKANDLHAKDLKRIDDHTYFGQVDGAWIYKTVNVVVRAPEGLTQDAEFNIQVSIADLNSNTFNAPANGSNDEYMLVDLIGNLNDTSDKVLADETQIIKNNKKLTISVYRDLKKAEYDSVAFDLHIDWLGNGSASSSIFAPIPASDINQFKAISISIDDPENIDPMVSLKLKGLAGEEFITEHPLSVLLHEAGMTF